MCSFNSLTTGMCTHWRTMASSFTVISNDLCGRGFDGLVIAIIFKETSHGQTLNIF